MHFHQSDQSRFLNASFNKRRSGNQRIRRALKIRGLRFTTVSPANQEPDNWTCGTDFWLRRNLALRLADSFFPRLVLAAVTREPQVLTERGIKKRSPPPFRHSLPHSTPTIKMAAISAVAPVLNKAPVVSTGKAANTNSMMVWQPHGNK